VLKNELNIEEAALIKAKFAKPITLERLDKLEVQLNAVINQMNYL
jgi:hypothetical protein